MPDFYRRSYSCFVVLLLFVAYTLVTSCVSTKKVVYFHDLPDTFSKALTINNATPFEDPKIQTNDILAITVQPLLQAAVNNPVSNSSTGNGYNTGTGSPIAPANTFIVDRNGYIEYSLIGKVKVEGLTTAEARDLIKQKAQEYYVNPVVNVRITNFEITVLGDVNKPGPFYTQNEKVTIIDAISNSGDLAISAKRDNILLVRSIGDQKVCARYDMSSSKIFQHPYFYLKQRDIIYVEPNKFKVQNSDQTFIRNLGILSSLISVASLLLVFKSIK